MSGCGMCTQVPTEAPGVRSPGFGGSAGRELPDTGAENRTTILWR